MSRYACSAVLLLLPFVVASVLRAEPLGPAWLASPEAAFQQAQASGKPVLIYFYGDRCPACKAMQRDVLARPEVIDSLRGQFVLLQVDADRMPQLAKQYGLVALPTTVVANYDGRVLDRIQGRTDAAPYLARLSQTAQTASRAMFPPNGSAPLPSTNASPASPSLPRMGDYVPPLPTNAPHVAAHAGSSPPTAYQNIPAPTVVNAQPYSTAAGYAPTAGAAGYSPPGFQPSANVSGPIAPVAPSAQQTGYPTPPPAAATVPVRSIGQPSTPGVPPAVVPAGVSSANAPPLPSPQVATTTQPGAIVPGSGYGLTTSNPNTQASPYVAPAAGPAPGQTLPQTNAALVPAGNPPLGLDGYCPVELYERQRWTPGDVRFGLIHRGRTYLFAGPEQRDRFNADPDRYAPILSGVDIVLVLEQGRHIEGQRRHGVFYNGHVYLFSSEETLQRFAQRPEYYADQALQALRAGAVPLYYR